MAKTLILSENVSTSLKASDTQMQVEQLLPLDCAQGNPNSVGQGALHVPPKRKPDTNLRVPSRLTSPVT